jgi:hypothetical protein
MKAAALIGALTVSLHTIFLLSLTFPTACTHHVVSYIHTVVPVNISGRLKSITDFRSKIIVLKTNYADTAIYSNRLEQYGGVNTNGPAKHLLLHFRRRISGLMDLLIKDTDVLRTTILSLKSSLPQVDNDNREKRSAGLIIGTTVLSGVFGTQWVGLPTDI